MSAPLKPTADSTKSSYHSPSLRPSSTHFHAAPDSLVQHTLINAQSSSPTHSHTHTASTPVLSLTNAHSNTSFSHWHTLLPGSMFTPAHTKSLQGDPLYHSVTFILRNTTMAQIQSGWNVYEQLCMNVVCVCACASVCWMSVQIK
jgi:hypothetical protein